MRVLLFVLLATISLSNGYESADGTKADLLSSSRAPHIFDGIFLTRIDHFRPQFLDRVSFNYQVNADHYRPGGALYIYIKDIRDETSKWIESGLMVEIAEETHAALFTFNQRFIGNNRPTQNASFESLEFMTVEQSLADIATFIRFIRSSPEVTWDTKVILWGSGYGGTMATWARKKYPHLIDGVWSSSGIFAIDLYSFTQYDFLEYTIFSVDSYECSDLLRDAFFNIDLLIRSDEGGYLQERLNLCHPVDTNSYLDIAALYESHLLYIMDYIHRHHSHGIFNFCRDMRAISGDPFSSFVRWIEYTYGTPECFDHSFNGMVERNREIAWNTEATNTGRRQWLYSQCTQIGSFLIADEFSWLPGRIPVIYHMEKCQQVLGENYNANLLIDANAALVREYGSLNASVTNVIYTNGAIDPWLYTGMLVTRNPNTVATTIQTYAKSADLTGIDPGFDTAILIDVKKQIRELIIGWSLDLQDI